MKNALFYNEYASRNVNRNVKLFFMGAEYMEKARVNVEVKVRLIKLRQFIFLHEKRAMNMWQSF
jgi:hypothetical protein